VASSQHLRIWPAIVVGIAGAFVYQGVYFVFVR
jgi:hypothetical protein